MKGKKESKRTSKKRMTDLDTTTEPLSPSNSATERQPREQAEELQKMLTLLLESYGSEEMVPVEVWDSDSPFFRPATRIRVATEGDCARNALYRYVRKTENYKEKIKLNVMNLKEKKEIGGLEVKGSLTDYILFKVILDLVKCTRTLTVLRLVDCSLKAEAIAILGNELGQTSVTHLYLDRNPVELQNYYCILEKNDSLRHLSLVQCRMDERGARLLGRQLGPPIADRPAHRLRSLNLSSNRIDSYAAKFIAQGLKWNRELIFLSLAGNEIGNIGMEFIAKAMQLSILEKWEKEFKERRLIERSERIKKMLADEYDSFERELMGEMRMRGTLYEGQDHFEESAFEGLLEEYIKNDPNPISRDVIKIDDNFVTPGNGTLKILDVSFNKIEEEGFEHLLNTLRYQMTERKSMSEEQREQMHLSSINLVGNFYPNRSKVIRKINYYLKEMKLMQEEIQSEWHEGEEESFELEVNSEMEEGEEKELKEQPSEKVPELQMMKKQLRTRGPKETAKTELDEIITINLEELLILPSGSESSSLEDFKLGSKSSESLEENQVKPTEQNIPCESSSEQ